MSCNFIVDNEIIDEDIQSIRAIGQSPSSTLEITRREERIYFSVHKDKQNSLNISEARSTILSNLSLPLHTQIMQIIGDSHNFSLEGTSNARSHIRDRLSNSSDLLMYGYTSVKCSGQTENSLAATCDTNHIISEWIEDNYPSVKAVGCIVDIDTPKSLHEGAEGCRLVKNFLLVHGGAKFGDDILTTDSLTDLAICFEGGIQSFAQICNFLAFNIPIELIRGIRDTDSKDIFSASGFLLHLYEHSKTTQFDEDIVRILSEKYLKEFPVFIDENNIDAAKKQLWESSYQQFLSDGLWNKFHLLLVPSISAENEDDTELVAMLNGMGIPNSRRGSKKSRMPDGFINTALDDLCLPTPANTPAAKSSSSSSITTPSPAFSNKLQKAFFDDES